VSEVVARVETPRGELVLRRDGEDLEVISNGVFLMDTRDGRSERLLVQAALEAALAPRRLLIGGLGVGFSLDEAVRDARVEEIVVVEIEEALLRWHRDGLLDTAATTLADPRVQVIVTDLVEHLRQEGPAYDVICVDVDNGPDWTVTPANDVLYDAAGLGLLRSRLTPHGVLAVWSAHAVPDFEALLRPSFRRVDVHAVDVPRGEPDVVYVATNR
jgi:spermidine synthase